MQAIKNEKCVLKCLPPMSMLFVYAGNSITRNSGKYDTISSTKAQPSE